MSDSLTPFILPFAHVGSARSAAAEGLMVAGAVGFGVGCGVAVAVSAGVVKHGASKRSHVRAIVVIPPLQHC